MKNQFQLGILFLLLTFFQLPNSFAQHDVEGDEPDPAATITPDPTLLAGFETTATTPVVRSTSVIAYSDGLSVSIEFETEGMTPANVNLVNQVTASDFRTLPVSAGKTQFFGLAAGKVYDIKAAGSDGRTYIIGTVNTNPYHAGDPVNVSPALYRALSEYVSVSPQTTTLSNYLKQVQTVSQHEQISFLQRYVMNGAVLPAGIKEQYPDAYVRQALQARSGEGTCLCNFITRAKPVAIPDDDGPDNITIKSVTEHEGPVFYNNSSFHSRGICSQGPAKYQLLFNAGDLAGNKRRTEVWESGSSGGSSNYALLGFHYLCLNFNEVPAECACQKTVKFNFDYSTRIEANTGTGGLGCLFNQEAGAEAQDWAIALVTREKENSVNDVQVLASGQGKATSTCSGGVPPSVVVDAVKIGTDVFNVLKSVKTGGLSGVLNGISDIADKIGDVLQKFLETKSCSNALIERPLVQGSAVITFAPNDPITFILMSGSALSVQGLRCWESRATIKSGFHAVGIMQGGSPDPGTPYCCTDYIAQWLTASQSGDGSNHSNALLGYLGLNGPGAWQVLNGSPNPSGQIILNECGTAKGSAFPNGGGCSRYTPDFSGAPR